jgi:ATP-dependent Clp protease ATP-binding subunit ClpB
MTALLDDQPAAVRLRASWPNFAREFDSTLAVHAQYVFHGNIRDDFVLPGDPTRLLSLRSLLWEVLQANDYKCLIWYDTVDGAVVHPEFGAASGPASAAAAQVLGDSLKALNQATAGQDGGRDASRVTRQRLFSQLRASVEAVAGNGECRTAFLIDYASHLARSPADLTQEERAFFLACAKLSATAPRWAGPPGREELFNPVIWLASGERDLPAWLTGGNPLIRTISVPAPDLGLRTQAARVHARDLGVPDPDAEHDTTEVLHAFAAQCDGLPLRAMREIKQLARDRGEGFLGVPDAIRTYKLGVVESPWRRRHVRDRIMHQQGSLQKRVIGQDAAVGQTLGILKRASLGLSGAQATSSAARPRGVLFFAGPTGVGKTELAKAVAALIFGDGAEETAFLRFDMSEFSAEHSADRLIGAPPGYVGFEAGGQLTNAIRQNPFRVILFDEIEKAHPQILDKFLQILEDGRLTDGQGQTTYFSESVIIFTSNLGIQKKDRQSGERTTLVTDDQKYKTVREKVMAGVREHFISELGRPELLNRLGANIVVFDFIRPEFAKMIFEWQLANTLRRVLAEHSVTVTLLPEVKAELCKRCTRDLSDGARGIGNELEAAFINPLAAALFDDDPVPGTELTVTGLGERTLDVEAG